MPDIETSEGEYHDDRLARNLVDGRLIENHQPGGRWPLRRFENLVISPVFNRLRFGISFALYTARSRQKVKAAQKKREDDMKTKLLAGLLLAGSSMFAGVR